MIENKSYAVTYPDDIQIEGTYNGFGMEISLNGERVGVESTNIGGTAKGYATGEVKNIITIQLAFGDGNIGSVSVNGTNIALPEGTKDRVEFTVEPANKYIIVVTKSQDTSNIPRTIIWESDKLNNTSLKPDGPRSGARENDLCMLKLCMEHGVMITLGSDAHVEEDICNFSYAEELLKEVHFPDQLIANLDLDRFTALL